MMFAEGVHSLMDATVQISSVLNAASVKKESAPKADTPKQKVRIFLSAP
jgi:hypothetical protein